MSLRIEWTAVALLGVEYRHIVVISEISLLYTIVNDTLFIEYVKNARLDDSTVWEKLSGF